MSKNTEIKLASNYFSDCVSPIPGAILDKKLISILLAGKGSGADLIILQKAIIFTPSN